MMAFWFFANAACAAWNIASGNYGFAAFSALVALLCALSAVTER